MSRLAPNAPGLRVSVGVSRSGKTFGIRKDVEAAAAAGMPVIVVDRMREWRDVPHSLSSRSAVVHSIDAGVRLIETSGVRLVILRPPENIPELWSSVVSMEACEWACGYRGLAGVCFNEAHKVAPRSRGALPSVIDDVVSAWAHHNVAVWADSQRLAKLHGDVTENATELRLYTCVGPREFATLRELGGVELADTVKRAGVELVAGRPGYHVRLSGARVPPYELTRDA